MLRYHAILCSLFLVGTHHPGKATLFIDVTRYVDL